MTAPHRTRREQDEFFCTRCHKRWAVGEAPPECVPLGQAKTVATDASGRPFHERFRQQA